MNPGAVAKWEGRDLSKILVIFQGKIPTRGFDSRRRLKLPAGLFLIFSY